MAGYSLTEKSEKDVVKNQEYQPLVSVLLPVYNVELYLEQCLLTVRNQTYRNLEIILVNDGSTDRSLDIIKRHAGEDSRIKFLTRENRGLIPTRMQEMELCTGDYFAFVDSDDWIEPDYIERLLTTALRYDADIVRCGDIIEFVEEGRKRYYCKASGGEDIVIRREHYSMELVPDLINTAYFNSIHSEIIKASLIDKQLLDAIGARSAVAIGEDLVINCEFYKRSSEVVFIPDRLYHYRKNPTSMMSARLTIDKFEKRVYDSYITFQAIGDVIRMFPGIPMEKYYQRLVEDIDCCVNHCFERVGNLELEKKAVQIAQEFVRLNQIAKINERRLGYLFKKGAGVTILQKTIVVTCPFIIKYAVKKTLMLVHKGRSRN